MILFDLRKQWHREKKCENMEILKSEEERDKLKFLGEVARRKFFNNAAKP